MHRVKMGCCGSKSEVEVAPPNAGEQEKHDHAAHAEAPLLKLLLLGSGESGSMSQRFFCSRFGIGPNSEYWRGFQAG